MHLKDILTYKERIIEIANRLGFSGLHIHNVAAAWMHPDKDDNLPLAFVATSGKLIDKSQCRARIEVLLGCQVDIVLEDPANVRSNYLVNSVSLEDKDVEAKLADLFGIPLEDITFTPLQGIDKAIAEGYVKQQDRELLMYQAAQGAAAAKPYVVADPDKAEAKPPTNGFSGPVVS